MDSRTVKCGICGRPYKVYPLYAGDQSACGACRAAAEEAVRRPDTPEEHLRRWRYFGGGSHHCLAARSPKGGEA